MELNIFGVISEWSETNKNVVQEKLKMAGGADVTVNVSSGGGDVFEGLAIANIISLYSGKTTGIGIGLIASAATLVLLSCKEKKMSENSFFMLHKSWGGKEGNSDEMKKSAEVMEKIDQEMAKIYTRQIASAGKLVDGDEEKTMSKVRKMMKEETWLTASEALEMGLIDSVVKEEAEYSNLHNRAVAQVRAEASKFKNIPKILQMAELKEKKSILKQLAAFMGLSSDVLTDSDEPVTETKTEAPESTPEAVSDDEKKEEANENNEAVSEKQKELEALEAKISEKQKQLDEIEASIKAKITYKSDEPKKEQSGIGYTQEQIVQASKFIQSLIQK